MKLHELKIRNCYYDFIEKGAKTFELRKNDRNFKCGDQIHFVNESGEDFVNHPNNLFQITYILKNVPQYGLCNEFCILSIKKCQKEE